MARGIFRSLRGLAAIGASPLLERRTEFSGGTGSLALGDATSDYETLFGIEAKRVTARRTKTDDAAFAAKLIKSAERMSDSPAMQILLYEKACQFGSASPVLDEIVVGGK